MNENISRLMDGELDDSELPAVLAAMKQPEHAAAWACYHAIGDALRGEGVAAAFACGVPERLAARLAAEPAVLAPRRTVPERISAWGFAAAATLAAASVVGWTAYSMLGEPPAAIARAGQAGQVDRNEVRQVAIVPQDYLAAHQEYAPVSALQVVGPFMRAVTAQGGELRP